MIPGQTTNDFPLVRLPDLDVKFQDVVPYK